MKKDVNRRIEGNASSREFLDGPMQSFSELEATIEANLKSTQKIKSSIKGSSNPADTRSRKLV